MGTRGTFDIQRPDMDDHVLLGTNHDGFIRDTFHEAMLLAPRIFDEAEREEKLLDRSDNNIYEVPEWGFSFYKTRMKNARGSVDDRVKYLKSLLRRPLLDISYPTLLASLFIWQKPMKWSHVPEGRWKGEDQEADVSVTYVDTTGPSYIQDLHLEVNRDLDDTSQKALEKTIESKRSYLRERGVHESHLPEWDGEVLWINLDKILVSLCYQAVL